MFLFKKILNPKKTQTKNKKRQQGHRNERKKHKKGKEGKFSKQRLARYRKKAKLNRFVHFNHKFCNNNFLHFVSNLVKHLPRFSNFTFHNLPSNHPDFRSNDFFVLGFGSRFCARPKEPSVLVYKDAQIAFVRRLRIYDYFSNVRPSRNIRDYDSRFKNVASSWLPTVNSPGVERICNYVSNCFRSLLNRPGLQQPDDLYRILRRLKLNPRIKICQSDKNLGLCVLDISDYSEIVVKHLRDRLHYTKIDSVDGSTWKMSLR